MIGRSGFAGVMLGASMLVGCGQDGDGMGSSSRSAEARYRMSVEVATPEGTKSGSSVWSRVIRKSIGPISPYNASFKAEAVAIDLPGGRTLFMLVKDQEGMVDAYFPELAPEADESGEQSRVEHVSAIGSSGASKVLPCTPEAKPAWAGILRDSQMPNYCPMLVTFKDITDPTSVQRVNPDDLAASFGKGYRLKAITVQVTDAPVTVGIQKRLGWLSPHPEPSLNPKHGPMDFSVSATFTHGDFRRGATQ
jgi:hypothetical protein